MFKWLFKSDRKPASSTSAGHSPASTSEGSGQIGALRATEIYIALQHHQAGRLAEAEAAYREVLADDPENFDALHLYGVVAFQLGQHETAIEHISKALARNPSNAVAHNNLGAVFRAQAKYEEAIACFHNALALSPGAVDAHSNLGAVFKVLGKLDEAAVHYERVIALAPDSPTGHLNLGVLYALQGKQTAAVDCYTKALEIKPDFFEAHFNLGNVFRDQGKLDDAADCYQKALALNPEFLGVRINLGHLFRDMGRLSEAADFYRKALALKPDLPDVHFSLGHVLRDQGETDDAIDCYQSTIALKPDFPEAHFILGQVLNSEGDMEGAVACFQKALSLNSDYAEARWALAMSQIPAVYETNADSARARVAFSRELDELENWFDSTRVAEGFRAVGVQQPFLLAYQEEQNRGLLQRYGSLCTRIMSDWFDRQAIPASPKRDNDGIVRVGVVSQHFYNHSVWNAIIKGWLQQLDRRRFSVNAFYLGTREDRETAFARANCSHFVQGHRELRQWVEAIISRDIDVLIYPEIGMDPMAVRLASLRLAPVQAAAWGHPETTGLRTVDYYLSAKILEPDNAQENYTEKLMALPNLGCFYKPPPVTAGEPNLGSLTLDRESPLLLCPGAPFKYAPEHDWVLVEIARRLGRCKLVFFTYRIRKLSEKLSSRLVAVFARNGLDFDQFVMFIPWQNSVEFYGLMKRADVFLDTIGFSGFNTAIQAAECGVPIVSREGRFMRGRLASGILKRMGLPELVAESEESYIAIAVKLAQDATYRAQVRERIRASRQILFEDIAPIRAMEDFLTEVTARR